ncbi:NADPH-dependent alpha-keto amide reductase [Komagataella phaffii CBS 7435]|uniref:2-dehydropantolactone reductase n=2 Tax=Komagataella phaffii TaxID=460519 RepID=C4R7V9_KOMPG|nr:NADPH-dependent alpha-keto amide reductase [Komagataella phaffii GS115]AOA65159.1 GQ67_04789T0 [Komagataella phaffii]CAH2450929.1 Putative NADPH-dependent alpha-keto amide reductase [Komagataella phaffii CBS 7435]AOA69799.1 GQ68_04761T0 [Komagataella phaffii GS115]CAY71684.1 NADPH-dependent alpha-keto amide reductase [Komagataella phaffii GS115]CCA40713.1 NADPH-dependent alpha-keto amide reductase [Komagataella phaffii CBS 7435]
MALAIPQIGFGTGTTWYKYGRESEIDQTLVDALVSALQVGITHLDGAECYGTALETRDAIKKANIPREKLWITEKYYAGDSSHKSKSKAANPLAALKEILRLEELEYVDLYLLHSPYITKETHGFTLEEAWGYLEEAQSLGLAKNIGVSNFTVADLEKILKVAKVKPQVNQIEYNAFLQDQTPGVVEFSQKNGILIEAYSPLAPLYKGDKSIKEVKEFLDYVYELGKKYGKSDTQVLLKWVLQKGIIPITTSTKTERVKEFLKIDDFQLEPSEVEKITTLGAKAPVVRQYWVPEYSKFD